MYFNNLIDSLSKNNDNITRLSNIIHPLSLFYLCDHYYGDEAVKYDCIIPDNKSDLLSTPDLNLINDFDIIHVQNDYFNKFCNEMLDLIDKKIIITTGQLCLPQIHHSEQTIKILNNPNIVLWISQNPIYENNEKYIAWPYGITHNNLEFYADILLNNTNEKTKNIIHLPFTNNTHSSRLLLPNSNYDRLSSTDFYKKLSESKYVISPIGDRPDCYRHYEAIGLGTIPISNINDINDYYTNIFGKNMYYCDINEMINIINNNNINDTYIAPNKDLICFNYYKDNINYIINIKKEEYYKSSSRLPYSSQKDII